MNKPITVVYEDFRQNMASLINNSGLPPFIIESVLCNFLNETRIAMEKQYQLDKTQYEKAESIHTLFKRVHSFLDEINETYKNKTILLVTHEGVSKAIYCYFNGVPEDGNLLDLGLKNCEVKKYILK